MMFGLQVLGMPQGSGESLEWPRRSKGPLHAFENMKNGMLECLIGSSSQRIGFFPGLEGFENGMYGYWLFVIITSMVGYY